MTSTARASERLASPRDCYHPWPRPAIEILLADADVLIDYRDSDLTILNLLSDHIGPVRVLREVLDEAPGISDRQCARLGIEIVRLETELMLEANNLPRSLSTTDRLCVDACDHHSWIA